jgi:hypothetical protein
MGERQLDIFGRSPGCFFSQKLTHAGQQEVNNGISALPLSSFFSSSVDSSSTVKSAPVAVS